MNILKPTTILSCIFLFITLTSCKYEVKEATTSLPNVIFIMADDLGWGDVGFNGQEKIKTPFIDQLARKGMVFNRMYAGSTVCGPSRVSLITGLHTGHSSVRGNPRWTSSGKPQDFKPEEITIAEVFKMAGYQTGIVGKWGLAENLQETKPNQQGFDYFYGFNKHRPAHHYYPENIWENDDLINLSGNVEKEKKGEHVQELFTQKALDFIDKSEDKPFFLYLPYTTPHYELTIPDTFKAAYQKENWPLRKMKPAHYYHDENGHVTYAAMVCKMDADIGRLLQKLKEMGAYENTLIIFTSDNGHHYDQVRNEFFNSNGPYRGKKRDLYEGGIRVPFVASWPEKIQSGTSSDHMAAFWDMKATFYELLEITPKEETDGISILPTLLGKENQQVHEHLYWEFNEGRGPLQAVTESEWKLVYFKEADVYELYNLKTDPSETQNLWDENPEIAQRLKEKLSTSRTEHPEFPLVKMRK